ncbi:MAG: colicin D domain-containing protein [Candidatus Acidiferrales bacterium]
MEGTYRGVQNVIHNFDASTGLNVITTRSGEFISGWRLSAEQIGNLLRNGNVQ